MEPHHDFHRFQKRQFAKKMAELLNVAAQAQRFGRLILVAPPKALGDLRAELSEGARALVVHEIHKDLTRLELPKLEEQIQTVVP
jgi:protein required for attachment to host cells